MQEPTLEPQRTFTAKEFARLINREVRTLYTWKSEGRLVPNTDFIGRYIYTEEDFEKVTGLAYREVYPSG